jgi:hypothetical protein
METLHARAIYDDGTAGPWHDMQMGPRMINAPERARAKALIESRETGAVRDIVVGVPGCSRCESQRESFAPDHFGSRACRSGGILAGGTRTHCSCRACL